MAVAMSMVQKGRVGLIQGHIGSYIGVLSGYVRVVGFSV